MRTLRKIRKILHYALFDHLEDVYVLDADGNKIIDYTDPVTGTVYYRMTGTQTAVYSTPVEFKASLSSELNEMHSKDYGVDQSSIYIEMCVPKGYLPDVKYGTKIWRNSEIEWEDEEHTVPAVDSSDYTVVGILDEYENFDWYLLQRNNHED